MENSERRLENVLPLEKERALFFEKDWEALVRSYDRGVGLDLGKVRVVGCVESDIGTQRKLRRHTDVRTDRIIHKPIRIPDRRRKHASSTSGLGYCDARDNFERPFVLDLVESGYLSMLDEKAGDVTVVGQPLIELVIEAIDVPRRVESPKLPFPSRIP